MPDGEEWVMRPVVEKMCLYESIKDGTIDLEDIAKMNDAIDVRNENDNRMKRAQQQDER